MLDGVKSFQREQGLKVDGVMKPNGPTIKRLNETLAEIRQAPQPHPSKAAHLGGYTSQTIPPFQREQGPIVDGEAQPRQEAKNELNNKIFIQKKVDYRDAKGEDRVELAFAPAVPIGIAFAEWLFPVLAVATVAAARVAFSALDRLRQRDLRKQYREETGKKDDEDDFCFHRWQTEDRRCDFRAPKWKNGCRERAAYRRGLCDSNGGKPHPQEPPEWSDADEIVGTNPR